MPIAARAQDATTRWAEDARRFLVNCAAPPAGTSETACALSQAEVVADYVEAMRGGAIGIGPARSRAHLGRGSGEDDLVILRRRDAHPFGAGNGGDKRRPTGKFQRPRDHGAAGSSRWESRLPNLMARTILHLDPPFALSTNMAAGMTNTSLLTHARVVPSLVLV